MNVDFPGQSDDYIHRIGRTGRAGVEGCAITFITDNDGERLKKLERHIGKTLAKRYLEGFNYKVPAPEEVTEKRFEKRKPRRHSGGRFEKSGRSKTDNLAKKRKDWRKPKKRK